MLHTVVLEILENFNTLPNVTLSHVTSQRYPGTTKQVQQVAQLLLRKSRSYSRADDGYSRRGNFGGSLVHSRPKF